jgi:hypothetical protein
MQRIELNCTTIEVANNREISNRVTADEIKRGLQTEEKRGFWRIVSSAILGYLMALGLFVALTPLPASADNDEGSRHGREDNDRGIRAEVTALQAQVAFLQATISALQDQVESLQTSNTALQTQLTNAKNVLALAPFVSVDPNPQLGVAGPSITFKGANLHIVSGSGSTTEVNNPRGLGNLIIGYDEETPLTFPLRPGDRGGSHNLVIGPRHRFTQAAFGGLVAGDQNTINNTGASVSGGRNNGASGSFASVSGGDGNTANGIAASVSGGLQNTARGATDSVSGGGHNTASGGEASVTGGLNNKATGPNTTVIGGSFVTDNKVDSIAPQPPFP